MSVNLIRRINALEASLAPTGKIVPFWAMKGCRAMTEEEVQKEIAVRKAAGAPANAQFIPVRWQTKDDR
jgi:hypothetical protein